MKQAISLHSSHVELQTGSAKQTRFILRWGSLVYKIELQIANYEFLLHMWSLAVEIQFYILAPLVVYIGQKAYLGNFLGLLSSSDLFISIIPPPVLCIFPPCRVDCGNSLRAALLSYLQCVSNFYCAMEEGKEDAFLQLIVKLHVDWRNTNLEPSPYDVE